MTAAPPRLVADVGGTNARFALQPPGARAGEAVVLRCADHAGIEAAARAALERARPTAAPRHAAIAVAAPVTGDRIDMTNHPWTFSQRGLRQALGLERLVVVNDFTAIALAVPRLEASERRQVGGGTPTADAPVAVIGPGTGLGISGLVPDDGGWSPLAGEGGHVDLAPSNAREIALLERLQQRFDHVSLERVLSGPGLVNLYRALAEIDGAAPMDDAALPTPEQIAERARSGACPLCGESVATFCALLGAAAGNLALNLGARGGVYIAGGIVPKLGTAFDEERFRRRFEAKGRFAAYLAPIPTYVITEARPALIGLASLLDNLVGKSG